MFLNICKRHGPELDEEPSDDRMMEESIWKHDRSKRCTYRLVWQGRLLGINQRDIGRENRSDRQ